MTHSLKRVSQLVAAATVLAGAGWAQAQSAGAIIVYLGATQIKPDVQSGDLTAPSQPGTKADIKADTRLTGAITYMWSDKVSLDLPLSAGFKHDMVGAGALEGVGKIAEVKALPVTLLVQYRLFGATEPLRPYVGIGPTYAKFYAARSTAVLTALTGGTPANPTTVSMKSKWGLTAQVGVSANLAPRWSLDLSVLKTALKSSATLSTGQSLDAKIDPVSFSAGVGYQF
jgi:outer membrane protein